MGAPLARHRVIGPRAGKGNFWIQSKSLNVQYARIVNTEQESTASFGLVCDASERGGLGPDFRRLGGKSATAPS